MAYYIFVEDEKLNGAGQCECLSPDIQSVEVEQSLYERYIEDIDRYIWNGSAIINNPDYEEVKSQKEQDRINNLTMTAWDFVEFLKSAGLTSSQIMGFLNANPDIQLHLTCCQNVYCGVAKSLMPITLGDITVTADMVEIAFRIKHGEKN